MISTASNQPNRTGPMYEIIYAGSGLSALLSAYYLIRANKIKGSLLFLDPLPFPLSNKTYSFWSELDDLPEELIHKSWDKLLVIDTETSVHQLRDHRYRTIKGAVLESWLRNYISTHVEADFREERYCCYQEEKSTVWVKTDKSIYQCSYFLNSTFDYRELISRLQKKGFSYHMQYFLGVEIETELDFFDDSCMTLADFSINTSGRYEFGYTLPYGKRSALIELVSDRIIEEDQLFSYLNKVLGATTYHIRYNEEGGSLLTQLYFPHRVSKRCINIGTAAGMLKASTGYAFSNVVRDSRLMADKYRPGKGWSSLPRRRLIFRWFDRVFLTVVYHRPLEVKAMFMKLFNNVDIDTVLSFLNEDCRANGLLKVCRALQSCALCYVQLLFTNPTNRRLSSNQPHDPVSPR